MRPTVSPTGEAGSDVEVPQCVLHSRTEPPESTMVVKKHIIFFLEFLQ